VVANRESVMQETDKYEEEPGRVMDESLEVQTGEVQEGDVHF